MSECATRAKNIAKQLNDVLQKLDDAYADAEEKERLWVELRLQRERHEAEMRAVQLRVLLSVEDQLRSGVLLYGPRGTELKRDA